MMKMVSEYFYHNSQFFYCKFSKNIWIKYVIGDWKLKLTFVLFKLKKKMYLLYNF